MRKVTLLLVLLLVCLLLTLGTLYAYGARQNRIDDEREAERTADRLTVVRNNLLGGIGTRLRQLSRSMTASLQDAEASGPVDFQTWMEAHHISECPPEICENDGATPRYRTDPSVYAGSYIYLPNSLVAECRRDPLTAAEIAAFVDASDRFEWDLGDLLYSAQRANLKPTTTFFIGGNRVQRLFSTGLAGYDKYIRSDRENITAGDIDFSKRWFYQQAVEGIEARAARTTSYVDPLDDALLYMSPAYEDAVSPELVFTIAYPVLGTSDGALHVFGIVGIDILLQDQSGALALFSGESGDNDDAAIPLILVRKQQVGYGSVDPEWSLVVGRAGASALGFPSLMPKVGDPLGFKLDDTTIDQARDPEGLRRLRARMLKVPEHASEPLLIAGQKYRLLSLVLSDRSDWLRFCTLLRPRTSLFQILLLSVSAVIGGAILLAIVLTIRAERERHVLELRAREEAIWKDVAFSTAHRLGNRVFALELTVERIAMVASTDRVARLVEELGQQIRRVYQIITHIRAFSKASAPRKRREGLAGLVERATLGFPRGPAPSDSKRCDQPVVTVDVDSTLQAFVDPDQFEEAVEELCANAAKSGRGQQVKIDVAAEESRGTTILTVTDDGPGIPPENLDLIWKPGFSTDPKGTGFGLYKVRRIIDGHGGTVQVESTVGRGTTVRIEVPRGPAE